MTVPAKGTVIFTFIIHNSGIVGRDRKCSPFFSSGIPQMAAQCRWLAMVDYITVHNKDDIRVTFKDGTEIKA